MKYCPSCSTERVGNLRYCAACRYDFATIPSVPAQPEVLTAEPVAARSADPGFGPGSSVRPSSTRSTVATVALGIIATVLGLSAVHQYSGIGLVENLFSVSDAEIVDYDVATQLLAGLFLLAFIGSAVAFLAWLSRSVDNVAGLTGSQPLASPRWSIGWWFVPIANFVMPFRIVRDLNERMTRPGQPVAGALVGWWWTCFLGWSLISTGAARYQYQTEAQAITYFQVSALGDCLGVGAAVLAILVVRRIQQKSDGLLREDHDAPARALTQTMPPAS